MPVMEQQALLTDRERELGAIISAYSEVTERLKVSHERLSEEVARLSGELREKNAELRRRDRLAALGEMAAGLAHEIRNPLGGIALYASMLEGQLAGQEDTHRAAARISQGVRILDRLVGEILDFAQEDRLELQACKLGRVLSEVEDSLRPWSADHDASVVMDEGICDVEVWCDPGRLRQVLLNLLVNGVQSAGAGGHVRLSARPLPDGGGTEIEVRDDGPGIPADQIDRIFNPFFTTRASGTGLGLAIVHRIVEAHGGSVRGGNLPEGGARFVLRLPSLQGEKAIPNCQ